MYPAEFEYFAPATVAEALALLARYGDDAKILAGGQSLLPMMKLRIASPKYLIDVNRIPALGDIRETDGRLVFGALCRHADIATSPLVRAHLPLMIDAATLTADVQVRNRGTIGGSLSHADPGGDWPAALTALETTVVATGPSGDRTVPLREFILDAYTTGLAPDEMLTAVSVRIPPPGSGGAYVKFEKRAGDFAVASVGIQCHLGAADRCEAIAISLGSLGATPIRAHAAEGVLAGQGVTDGRLSEAARLVEQAADPFDDTRGSVAYKRHLAGVLFRRGFDVARARAHGEHAPTLHV